MKSIPANRPFRVAHRNLDGDAIDRILKQIGGTKKCRHATDNGRLCRNRTDVIWMAPIDSRRENYKLVIVPVCLEHDVVMDKYLRPDRHNG
jgi:hypothetical protein